MIEKAYLVDSNQCVLEGVAPCRVHLHPRLDHILGEHGGTKERMRGIYTVLYISGNVKQNSTMVKAHLRMCEQRCKTAGGNSGKNAGGKGWGLRRI